MEVFELPESAEGDTASDTTSHEPETPTKTSMLDTSLTFNRTSLVLTKIDRIFELESQKLSKELLSSVAIHTILYVRQIYPPDLFVRRKKYDTPVFQSRHPALNEYISGAVKAIADELALGNVNKVIVVIKDKDQAPLERFIFCVQNMIEVDSYNRDTSVRDAMTLGTLSQYFRSFLIKLTMIESQLGLLEPQGDVSFTIVLELDEDQVPSAEQEQDPPPWVPVDNQHTTAGVSDNVPLHFLRVVDTGIVSLSLAVQESDGKTRKQKKLHGGANPDPTGKGKEKVA